MRVEELKKQYPNKTFIQVDEFKTPELANITSIDNIINLDDTFLYIELNLDEQDATDMVMQTSIDLASNEVKSDSLFNIGKLSFKKNLESMLEDDDYYNKFYNKCRLKNATFITLRSLKYNISYEEQDIGISEKKQEDIINLIFNLYDDYKKKESEKGEIEYNTIYNFIKDKSSEYSTLTTAAAKTKMVKNIQFKLKDKFGDLMNRHKFSDAFIEYILSGECENI